VKGKKGRRGVGLPGADGIAYRASAPPLFKFYLAGFEFYKGSIRISPNVEWVATTTPRPVDVQTSSSRG
jgi:hypothetical protein